MVLSDLSRALAIRRSVRRWRDARESAASRSGGPAPVNEGARLPAIKKKKAPKPADK